MSSHFSPLHMALDKACQALYDVFTEAGGIAPTEAAAHVLVDAYEWAAKNVDLDDVNIRELVEDNIRRIAEERKNRS